MDKVQLRNRTLCNLKIISFIIFFQPFRSYKAVGLSLIIISTGLILKHFLNIFGSKKVIKNIFIIIFLIAILLLGISALTGGLK